VQERDSITESDNTLRLVTQKSALPNELNDLLFANKIVKHTKSNAIVLVKTVSLSAAGLVKPQGLMRVKQAIEKPVTLGST